MRAYGEYAGTHVRSETAGSSGGAAAAPSAAQWLSAVAPSGASSVACSAAAIAVPAVTTSGFKESVVAVVSAGIGLLRLGIRQGAVCGLAIICALRLAA